MIDPWRNGYLESGALCPLDNPVLQRDSARDLAAVLADRNDAALALHREDLGGASIAIDGVVRYICSGCSYLYPCPTVRALTGSDSPEVA